MITKQINRVVVGGAGHEDRVAASKAGARRHRGRKGLARVVATGLSAVLLGSGPGWAVTSTDDPGPNGDQGAAGTPSNGMFPAVGKINLPKDLDGNSGILGSGTLIGPMHMITAAHVFTTSATKGGRQSTSGTAMFEIPKDKNDPSKGTQMVSAEFMRVKIHGSWNGNTVDDHDLAVVKLKKNIVDVLMDAGITDTSLLEPLMMGTATNEVNMPITLVGWGNTNGAGNTTGTKRHGDNEVDSTATDGKRLKADFDGDGTDSGTTSGDSGGAWIKEGKLIGVHSSATGTASNGSSRHGSMMFASRVSQHTDFINGALEEPQIGNFSGSWSIDKENFIPKTDPNAHFGFDTLDIEETVKDLSPFDIEITVQMDEGGGTTLAIDKKITNDTRIAFSDFHMTLGTGIGDDFMPINDPVSGGMGFLLDPFPQEETGKFELVPNEFQTGLDAFGSLPDGEMALFWMAMQIQDSADGENDGMATFTMRQVPTIDPTLGDMDGSGTRDSLDIDPFVDVLTGASPFDARADINGDGMVNTLDVDGFARLLTGNFGLSGLAASDLTSLTVPEPGTGAAIGLGLLGWLGGSRRRRNTQEGKVSRQGRGVDVHQPANHHRKPAARRRAWAVGTMAAAAMGLILSATSPSEAAMMYLSTTAPASLGGGGATVSNPSVSLAPGGSTTLYIYFVPGSGDAKYNGIAANITAAASGVVSATAFSVSNPSIDVTGTTTSIGTRWNGTGGSLGTDTMLVTNMNGVSVTTPGLLETNTGSPNTFIDRDFDASAGPSGAFHFGSVTIMADSGAAVGASTTLSLSVGSTLIARTGDTAASGAPVFFGASEATSVSGSTSGATGAIADATITIFPEPTSLTLLGLAGAGLIGIRPRRTA